MSVRLIRVSSRATGTREFVRVYVYDNIDDLRAAAIRFHPDGDMTDTIGVCQTYTVERIDADGTSTMVKQPIVVRLWRERIGSRVVTHEISHAATEIYGRTVGDDLPASEHLHNANEILAHLHSDLTAQLVDRLYDLGYYSR